MDNSEEENYSILNAPMNTKWKYILFGLLTTIISFYTIKSEYQSLSFIDDDIIGGFSSIWYGLLKLILLVIGIYSIFSFFKSKKTVYVVTTLIPLFTLIAILFISMKIEERDSSPKILRAYYGGDLNGLTLILRENETYEFGDYGFLGGTINFGEYHIVNDTIYLSEEFPLGEYRKIVGNKLLIRDGIIFLKQDENGDFLEDEYLKLQIDYTK